MQTDPNSSEETLKVSVLSSMLGRVAGSEALVELLFHGDGIPEIRLNQAPVEIGECVTLAKGRLRTVVAGLRVGDNVLEIVAAGKSATCRIRSFPLEGPVFSGPHLKPWRTTTTAQGLGDPLDSHGNAAPVVSYKYMSLALGEFRDFDPSSPASADDIAPVTTDAGETVPYIVRHEIGAINRHLYELAVLCRPGEGISGVRAPRGWNGKLWVYLHGGWNQYWSQGEFVTRLGPVGANLQTVLIDIGLRRGFMIARTTASQSATNSDTVRAAETLLMLKDRIVTTYGQIRYTIGSGNSGGSIMQQMIANQYPGLFNGIIPMSSVHATWYIPGVLRDLRLLAGYFSEVSPALWREEAHQLAVYGYRSLTTPRFFIAMFDNMYNGVETGGNDPGRGTSLLVGETYDPETNPSGARGTMQDYQVNYLGRRSEDIWSAAEARAGVGFANLPWENVGVQYGLGALLNGTISPEQFVDLNEKIGGVDIDENPIPSRVSANPLVIERLCRTGLWNDFANLSTTCVIDQRPSELTDLPSHTHFHTWVTRQGLIDAQGHFGNHVAMMVPSANTSTTPFEPAFVAMDAWLTAVEADESPRPLTDKIVANRPKDLIDGIYDAGGYRIGSIEDYHREYPSFGDPRTVAAAGSLRPHLVAKPHLVPLDRTAYPGVTFSDEQWDRLLAVFPYGVADWNRPGIGETRSIPWLDYSCGPGGEPF